MRCDNCGYENAAGVNNCIKCGSPLGATAPSNPFGGDSNEPAPSKTVFEVGHNPASEPMSPASTNNEEHGRLCECGYPLMPSSYRCPKCGRSIEPHGFVHKDKPVVEQPAMKNKPFTGTVDPYSRQIFHQCRLVPVSRDGEKKLSPVEISEGNGLLNRAVLDPENPTISGKEQAEMTFKDGCWSIEDKSSLKTTFLHIGRPQRLKHGDVILLGDRRFILEEE